MGEKFPPQRIDLEAGLGGGGNFVFEIDVAERFFINDLAFRIRATATAGLFADWNSLNTWSNDGVDAGAAVPAPSMALITSRATAAVEVGSCPVMMRPSVT